jgi:hypothetical protein
MSRAPNAKWYVTSLSGIRHVSLADKSYDHDVISQRVSGA